MRFLNLLIFSCCFGITSWSQNDSTHHRKVGVLPVPAFGYAPETSTYVGAVSLFTFDFYNDSTRSSNAKLEFNYTWKKQIILESDWNYFFKEEKWFTHGLLHFSKYPDSYFGIGPESKQEDLQQFQTNRIKTEINLLRKLKNQLFLGGGIRYFDYSRTILISDTSAQIFSELADRNTFGVSGILLNDKRNNLLTPTSGYYAELELTQNFSSSNYGQISFDYRKYFKPWRKWNHSLSTRFLQLSTIGNPAYFDYALFGGDKVARGYFYGRFRDKNISTIQAEYRMKLFWRVGLSFFGGTSLVYPSLKNWNNNYFKPNAGLGLRFLVDKKENTSLRFDYAVGADGQNGFYISFGESF